VEELIKTVTEKANINPEQAKHAITAVMEFIKTKMPGMGEQIAALLAGGGGGDGIGDVIGSVRSKLGF